MKDTISSCVDVVCSDETAPEEWNMVELDNMLKEKIPYKETIQLSDEEIQKIVDEVVTSAGLSGPAAMGKAMGMIKPKVAGKADMGRVSALLKARLAQ